MTEHTDTPPRPGHPVEALLCSLLRSLRDAADVPVWSMDEATTDRVVVLAARVAAGVAELEARAVGHAETLGRPGAAQCRSVAQWLQRLTHVTGPTASAKATTARTFARFEATRAAVARGEVHVEQARSIAETLQLLEGTDRDRAETVLLRAAADRDAHRLSTMGEGILERLDPEGAEAREAEALERQEARARARTRLSLYDAPDGLTHGRFAIPVAAGAMLRKAIGAIAAPKSVRGTQGAGSYDWQVPTPHQRGLAFVSYIQRFPTSRLPKVGGLNATVIAIGDAEILRGKVKAARLDTGVKVSHTDYLRLACEAGIIPMWMDADDQVLSVGRRHRFHTTDQRLAAIVEQRHCQHRSGCTVPGYLCHLHHPRPWADGGETSLRNATLLCPFHHGLEHAANAVTTYPMRT